MRSPARLLAFVAMSATALLAFGSANNALATYSGANGPIFFSDADDAGSVRLLRLDPDGDRTVIYPRAGKSDPILRNLNGIEVSRDGTEVVMEAEVRVGGQVDYEILIVSSDGKSVEKLRSYPSWPLDSPRSPSWSPNGERIALVNGGVSSPVTSHISVARHTGGLQPVRVYDSVSRGSGSFFGTEWSPTNELVVARVGDDPNMLIRQGPDFSTASVAFPGPFFDPAWSPDGTRLAFADLVSSGGSSQIDVFVANRDGSNMRRITDNSVADLEPVWSPDGNSLLIQRGGESSFSGSLVEVQLDDLSERVLTSSSRTLPAGNWMTNGFGGLAGTSLSLSTTSKGSVLSRLSISAKGKDLTTDRLDAPDANPAVNGAKIEVIRSHEAAGRPGSSATYTLPASNWTRSGSQFTYRDKSGANGPINSVSIKSGSVKIKGSGDLDLGYTHSSNIGVVRVTMIPGSGPKYCMKFGGTVTEAPGRYVKARNAPAPSVCVL